MRRSSQSSPPQRCRHPRAASQRSPARSEVGKGEGERGKMELPPFDRKPDGEAEMHRTRLLCYCSLEAEGKELILDVCGMETPSDNTSIQEDERHEPVKRTASNRVSTSLVPSSCYADSIAVLHWDETEASKVKGGGERPRSARVRSYGLLFSTTKV